MQRDLTLLDDTFTVFDIPAEMRGNYARISIGGQSGMLHSLMVYVERA